MLKPLGGIRNLSRIPDAMFIIDPFVEVTAVNEARTMHVPIVAVVDTNCNPLVIDYPIPGNDDAIRAVNLFAGVIANAVISGKKELQMSNEGQDSSAESMENVAYVSRVDKATDEEIGTQTSFSPDEDYMPEDKVIAQVAEPTEEEILREQYQSDEKE
jgi:small subunit ribosomal protein S2